MVKSFKEAGFSNIENNTHVGNYNNRLKNLLKAQNYFAKGSNRMVYMFVSGGAFNNVDSKIKSGKIDSKKLNNTMVAHWVTLTSNIEVREFKDRKTPSGAYTILKPKIAQRLQDKVNSAKDAALDSDMDETVIGNLGLWDKTRLTVYSWGNAKQPLISPISGVNEPRLTYFLVNYYGYIAASW